ncbi:MAG: hypothetical protein CMB73_00605 [Euryarchaeota archaeon]|nr:hypothetical protein [Euryarchaeota archaeon]
MGKDLTISVVPPHNLVIDAKDLTVSRGGAIVVEDINMQVRYGEFIGIVGPNGGGKTTLMLAILGVLKSYKGSVKLYGLQNTKIGFKSRIAWVSQNAANIPESSKITVRELISLGTVTFRNMIFPLDKERKESVQKIIEMVGLSKEADKQISKLSGGQKQRAVIGKALVSKADLLLLDEPLVGVDRKSRNSLLKLLDDLCHDQNKTIVMISHDLAAIKQTTHRIIYIDQSVQYDGKPEDLPELEILAGLRGIKKVHGEPGEETERKTELCCDEEA